MGHEDGEEGNEDIQGSWRGERVFYHFRIADIALGIGISEGEERRIAWVLHVWGGAFYRPRLKKR